jgi:hypothetical protein
MHGRDVERAFPSGTDAKGVAKASLSGTAMIHTGAESARVVISTISFCYPAPTMDATNITLFSHYQKCN